MSFDCNGGAFPVTDNGTWQIGWEIFMHLEEQVWEGTGWADGKKGGEGEADWNSPPPGVITRFEGTLRFSAEESATMLGIVNFPGQCYIPFIVEAAGANGVKGCVNYPFSFSAPYQLRPGYPPFELTAGCIGDKDTWVHWEVQGALHVQPAAADAVPVAEAVAAPALPAGRHPALERFRRQAERSRKGRRL